MKDPMLNSWINALGWTLLHSLWQGAVIWTGLSVIRKSLPSGSSSLRYALSTSALLLMILASGCTFLYLSPEILSPRENTVSTLWTASALADREQSIVGIWSMLLRWIESHLPSIVQCWAIGALLFALRLAIGWWRVLRLEQSMIPAGDFWKSRLATLAAGLSIHRTVLLGESKAVGSPILLGIVRPVILLPVGMLSGLSIEQVESILLHELAHIKRHDYIINLLQSLAETVYFYNPFVWLVSAGIRTEREHCCDDSVTTRKDPIVYAKALHLLEEARAGQTLTLAATGTPNQLLSRIRRIMEKDEKKEGGSGKVLSALFAMMTLVLVSWISIQAALRSPAPDETSFLTYDSIPADTTKDDLQKKKNGEKSAVYSRKSITTYDENGQPHEEITENFEGDEGLREMMKHPGFDPSVWDESFMNDSLLMGFHTPGRDPFLNFGFMDTIPFPPGGFDGRDWEEYSRKFTEEFQEHFGDFYKQNQREFEKMMKELDQSRQWRHGESEEEFRHSMEEKMSHLQELLQSKEFMNDAVILQKQAEMMQKEALRRHKQLEKVDEEALRHQSEQLKAMAEDLELLQGSHMNDLEREMKNMESRMKAFERAIQQELIKDGYLDKDADLQNLDWSDSEIKVNGKRLKDQDVKKYEEIRRKYLKDSGEFHYTE